jgi:hypothetical protein
MDILSCAQIVVANSSAVIRNKNFFIVLSFLRTSDFFCPYFVRALIEKAT